MSTSKADFRALRETVGLSQQDMADALEVDIRSVKRWEAPNYDNQPVSAAWALLERYHALHVRAVEIAVEQVERIISKLGHAPQSVRVTYWRDQAEYDVHGRDRGPFGVANANSRAVAEALRQYGVMTEFVYWDDGNAISTPGSRY